MAKTTKPAEKRERGRPRKIETPEIMMEHFQKYREYVKNNPIRVQDYVGKDGDMVYRDKQRPLTIEGFECWCYEKQIITDISDYFENKNDSYSEFLPICRAIRKIIRNDQIEGGMAGIYNPSITQRLNGLTEKTESKTLHEFIGMEVEYRDI